MIYSIHPENPHGRLLKQASELLNEEKLVCLPGDSKYLVLADFHSRVAIQHLKEIVEEEALLPLRFCSYDLSDLGHYFVMNDLVFKTIRKVLPGPYTFILPGKKELPRYLADKRDKFPIRIPKSPILEGLFYWHKKPLVLMPVLPENDYAFQDGEDCKQRFGKKLSLYLDGGPIHYEESTIVEGELEDSHLSLIREGSGEVEALDRHKIIRS